MGLGTQEGGRCGILEFRDQGVSGAGGGKWKQKDKGCPERMGGLCSGHFISLRRRHLCIPHLLTYQREEERQKGLWPPHGVV